MEHTETLHEGSHIVAATWLKRKNEEIAEAVIASLAKERILLDMKDLTSKSRVFETIFARSLCTFILWAHYDKGATAVGKLWRMDHSTVIHQRASVVNKIEAIGWCGRTYVRVCEALGEKQKDYIHPMLITKPVNRVVRSKTGEMTLRRANGTRSHLETEKVVDWTPEQRARIRILRKFPGGAPRDIIERFEKKFKTTL